MNEFEPQYHINCPPPPTHTRTHKRNHPITTTSVWCVHDMPSLLFLQFQSYTQRQIPAVETVGHINVTQWKRFPRYWPFLRGIHWWLMVSPHKEAAYRIYGNIRLNKKLSLRWLEMLACSLWHHCNDLRTQYVTKYVHTICRAFFTLVLIYIFLLVEWYNSFTATIQGCFTGAVVWFAPVSAIWSWRICVKLVATHWTHDAIITSL